MLLRAEIVPMAAHQRQQSAILRPDRIEILPAGQKVMIDQPDHVEAVGHDPRLGKVLAHQGAITGGQIHADDS